MKISWNLLFQAAAMLVQYGNQASGLVPPKYQPALALAVGLAQGLVAWRSHYFNPDGTPASVGYQKAAKILLFAIFLSLLCVPDHAQASTGFTKLANVTSTTYTDTTCPNLSTCFYQVTALDATGHESAPATCSASSLCFGTNQVVAQMPSSGTHTVALTWAASTSSGVTYNVYQHIGPFAPSSISVTVN